MLVYEGFSMSFTLSISTHISVYTSGLFHQDVSWGTVIISSCLLLIGNCLWLLSGNGKRDWLKAVNCSSYYCHMKTWTCREKNRHRDTDRDTQHCLFQRNVNEPTSTSCDQDHPPHALYDNMILKEMWKGLHQTPKTARSLLCCQFHRSFAWP